ncbi:hypothetical protein O181_111759 [Austropuccinia psidii MF-1]|uniref:Uncharacterized protein n=1 Tax=Austropuccinia psidii MF-1 TaxID=1389203 RepID=A0A9Q3PS36_9BASI|nr:hypothetical protein [Austropuccinia psidii MF-1]
MDVAAILTWSQVGANWPHQIFYAQLVPSGALWPFGLKTSSWPFLAQIIHLWPQVISCRHWPPWPISIPPTPRPLSLILGLGGPLVYQGVLGPLAIIFSSGPPPFIRGVRPKWPFWARPPTASTAHGP